MASSASGRTRTSIRPVFKKSEFDNRPVQVRFEKSTVRLWDAKSRGYLEESEFVGNPIKSQFQVDRLSSIRFAAKAALGGGYSVYGDEIRQAIDCGELRRLMRLDVNEARNNDAVPTSNVMICDRFHPDTIGNVHARTYKVLCELHRRSAFICVPHHDAVSFHVGVPGSYMCSIICPADGHRLPIFVYSRSRCHDLDRSKQPPTSGISHVIPIATVSAHGYRSGALAGIAEWPCESRSLRDRWSR